MIITFLAPAVIIFLVVFLYPIIRTVMMSFYKIDAVTDKMADWTFTGLANYQKLLSTPIFATAMLNILKIWLIGGIIVLGLSLLFAVILTSGIRFKKFFRAVIYMPNIISAVALATMWQQYVYNSKFGLLTSVLKALHLDALAKTPWLDPDHLFWSMLFAYCFGMVGYHMLIWCSGIERISPDLFEAATIDGANKPKQFWYISRPLLKEYSKQISPCGRSQQRRSSSGHSSSQQLRPVNRQWYLYSTCIFRPSVRATRSRTAMPDMERQ